MLIELNVLISAHTYTNKQTQSAQSTKILTNLDKPECKRCTKALQELENIDDEADQLDIGFVKIHDEALADEYNLGALPALVYYRHQIPILYEGSAFSFCKYILLYTLAACILKNSPGFSAFMKIETQIVRQFTFRIKRNASSLRVRIQFRFESI